MPKTKIPASERTLAARIAAEAMWAQCDDRAARTAAARAARDQKFLDAAGGDPVKAKHLRRQHFTALSLKSAQSRRRARELTTTAEAAEAELSTLGDDSDD